MAILTHTYIHTMSYMHAAISVYIHVHVTAEHAVYVSQMYNVLKNDIVEGSMGYH